MITVIIGLLFAGGCSSALYFGLDWSLVWSLLAGVLAFGVFQAVAGLRIQKKVKKDMERVQGILASGQKRLQMKMQSWQFRPPSSIQAAQREIFEDTKVFVREALAETESLSKYRGWVPMIDRQKATAQLQLNWMIKEFDAVDRLMPKALLLDPTVVAVKMARMYMKKAASEEIEKVYRKGVARVRYNGNVLLAATMSWILVQRKDYDSAFKLLTDALKKSDNEVLKQNHEHLMNNRPLHFSNSGIGDPWYALFLEEPKIHTQRPRNVYR